MIGNLLEYDIAITVIASSVNMVVVSITAVVAVTTLVMVTMPATDAAKSVPAFSAASYISATLGRLEGYTRRTTCPASFPEVYMQGINRN